MLRVGVGRRGAYTLRTFHNCGLHPHVVHRLQEGGFSQPTHIQTLGINAVLNRQALEVDSTSRASQHPTASKASEACDSDDGVQTQASSSSDVVIAAETGSGKTLAYVLPIVSSLLHGQSRKASALILCPNVILCEQVARVTQLFACLPHDSAGLCDATNVESGDKARSTLAVIHGGQGHITSCRHP